MPPDDSSIDAHVARLVGPARDAIGPRGMLRDSDDDYSARRLWMLAEASEVIDAFAAAGAAVSQGEIVEITDRGVARVEAPGLVPDSGYYNSADAPVQWGCTREPGERWRDYVSRCAQTFMAPVRALELEVLLGRAGDFRVDLGFVTEDEPSLFELPGYLRAALRAEPDASAMYGLTRLRWGRNTDNRRVDAAGAVAGTFYGGAPTRSIAALPTEARYAFIDGGVKDIAALARLAHLEALRIWRPTSKTLEALPEMPALRVLELEDARATSLDPLARHRHLEIVYCAGRPALTDVSALEALPRLWHLDIRLPGLHDLAPLGNLDRLKVLCVAGEKARVDSLAPLAALHDLRRFSLWGVAVGDQSLRPFTGLSKLLFLEIQTSRFKLEEFAALAAALPDAAGPHRSPWMFSGVMAQITRCKQCGAAGGYSTLGKPSRSFCFQCDAAKIAQHVARWEILVSAARARRPASD